MHNQRIVESRRVKGSEFVCRQAYTNANATLFNTDSCRCNFTIGQLDA